MILYSEKDLTKSLKKRIYYILGESISVREQWKLGTTGSNLYRLRKLDVNGKTAELTDLNSRCNFEKFRNGLLLRINNMQKLYFVAMSYDSIDSIKLTKGDENISPLFLSPMGLLLRFGVHVRYALYFKLRASEYSIEPMTLSITSGNDYISLDSSGYSYYGALDYFMQIIRDK